MSEGKDRIANAFVELLREKPAEDIPVKEVISRAGVSRTAYYYHFRKTSDIADHLIKGFTDAIYRGVSYTRMESATLEAAAEARRSKSVATFTYIYEHRDVLVALMNSAFEPRLRTAIREEVESCFEGFDWYCRTADGSVVRLDPMQRAYYIPQCALGAYSLIESWARRSFAETPQQVAELSFFFDEAHVDGLSFRVRERRTR